jgi:multidrug efflux pump subunit AcrA (membrane-fusion protein)
VRAVSRALVLEAIVPNPGGLLHPGLFATARIELPAARASLLVPATAVQSEAGVSKLFVARNDRADLRIVQVGRELDGQLEILRGLSAGERVVSRPVEGLADGVTINQKGT